MPRPIRPPRLEAAPNGWYYVHFYDAGRRRTERESLGTRSPEEAQARFAVWLTQEQPKAITAPTVSQVFAFYDAGVIEKEVVGKRAIRAQIRNVEAKLGHLPAADVTKLDMETFVDEQVEAFAAGTVRNQLAYLTAAYNFAFRKGFISCPPPVYEKPEASDPRDRWMTVEEMKALFDAGITVRQSLGEQRMLPVEIFIHLGLRTAARSNAILDLEWRRVDLDRGVIDYRSKDWLALPKRRRSKRRTEVPISDKLRPVLERAKAESTDAFVVPRWRGIRYDWKLVIKESGLVGVSPHIMRHTWATHASMNGVHMGDIARVMAITVDMAEKVYAKYAPGYLRSAVNF